MSRYGFHGPRSPTRDFEHSRRTDSSAVVRRSSLRTDGPQGSSPIDQAPCPRLLRRRLCLGPSLRAYISSDRSNQLFVNWYAVS